MNKNIWILIILAVIILIVIYNNSQKKLRDAVKRTDATKATETKTTTLPNADPTKPPVTVVVPPTANYNSATFKQGASVYAGEDMNAYLTPDFSLGSSNVQSTLKKGALIGIYLSSDANAYTISKKAYAYNYFFPIGPLYIESGATRVYVPKAKKVYTK